MIELNLLGKTDVASARKVVSEVSFEREFTLQCLRVMWGDEKLNELPIEERVDAVRPFVESMATKYGFESDVSHALDTLREKFEWFEQQWDTSGLGPETRENMRLVGLYIAGSDSISRDDAIGAQEWLKNSDVDEFGFSVETEENEFKEELEEFLDIEVPR